VIDTPKAALAAGQDELIPADHANRLLNGESPLRVYRDLRGLTQATLASRSGANRVTVAEIETGRKQGSVTTLRALACTTPVRPLGAGISGAHGDDDLLARGDLRPIFEAPTAGEAERQPETFEEEWGKKYPAIAPAWRLARSEVTLFLAFSAAIRKIIYTTNAVESLNRVLRKP